MSRLLNKALANSSLRDQDLAKAFGYGAPFSATYRSWLHKTGVIELRFPIVLTSFGEIILNKDPDFSKAPTLWYFHQQLTEHPDRAEAWHFFMGEFRLTSRRFSMTDLRDGLVMKLSAHDPTHFGPQSKMIPVIARKLLECYTSDAGLGSLKLLHTVGTGMYEFSDEASTSTFATPEGLGQAY